MRPGQPANDHFRWALVAVIAIAALTPSIEADEEPGVFFFRGCQAFAKSGKKFYPVVSVDARKIRIRKNGRIAGVSKKAPCRVEEVRAVADRYIAAADLVSKATRRGDAAKAEMTVDVGGTLTANADMQGVYAILVVMPARAINDYAPDGDGRIARASYVGDIEKENAFEMLASFAFPEFDASEASYTLHLYERSGTEIAMNTSYDLRAMSLQDYGKLKIAVEGSLR